MDKELLTHTRLTWSKFKDSKKRTVTAALHQVDASIKASFFTGLRQVLSHTNRFEMVDVHWWTDGFIYVDVKDTRWKHYPCGHRFLVSFDILTGLWADEKGQNYSFARKGWGAFAKWLVGRPVRKYTDCGDKNKSTTC